MLNPIWLLSIAVFRDILLGVKTTRTLLGGN